MTFKKSPLLLLALLPVLSLTGTAQTSEPVGSPGKMSRELWWNMSTRNDLEYSWQQAAFYQPASAQSEIDLFESPVNIGDQYSQRLRGYIIAPVTGKYRFWASGDDQFALWLGFHR